MHAPANILRIVLAVMLATCSPAWCACVLAQPRTVDSACCEGNAVAPACDSRVVDACESAAPSHAGCDGDLERDDAASADSSAADDHSQCACSCCDSTNEFSMSRDLAHSAAKHVCCDLAPLPQALLWIAIRPDWGGGDGGGGAGGRPHARDDVTAGVSTGQSLLAQRCLLLT